MSDHEEPAVPAVPAEPDRLLLRGYAPLVVGLLLAIAIVLLVPSVAPERVVVDPGTAVPADEVVDVDGATADGPVDVELEARP